MADRWIVSRFNRAAGEAHEALSTYRFDQYAKTIYDFFWRDFCDWYVEAAKPAVRDPNRAGQTAHVLAAVLDASLRLMHPMIPFITEVIYQKLNEIRPARGLPGRIDLHSGLRTQHSGLLIKAPWPTVGDFSQAAEHIFPKLQEVIGAIRNARNAANVPQRQKVNVTMIAPPEPARQINENREMIELLATCTITAAAPDATAPPNAIRTSTAGVEIHVDLADPNADKAMSEKRCADLKKQIATLRGRLSNESYTAKAPAHLVQQTKDQLAAAEAEAAKLGCGE
jgi:valyl-tRNA synthetase